MKKLLLAIALLSLAACDARPPRYATQLSFDRVKAVPVNATGVDFVNRYVAPGRAPNVEHLFREAPAAAVERLARLQLVPSGARDTLRVYIDKAAVVLEKKPQDLGFTDRLAYLWQFGHVDPPATLKGEILLNLELIDPAAPDVVIAHASVRAQRTRELADQASPAERDAAYTAITQGMLNDISEGFNTTARSTFAVK